MDSNFQNSTVLEIGAEGPRHEENVYCWRVKPIVGESHEHETER